MKEPGDTKEPAVQDRPAQVGEAEERMERVSQWALPPTLLAMYPARVRRKEREEMNDG